MPPPDTRVSVRAIAEGPGRGSATGTQPINHVEPSANTIRGSPDSLDRWRVIASTLAHPSATEAVQSVHV